MKNYSIMGLPVLTLLVYFQEVYQLSVALPHIWTLSHTLSIGVLLPNIVVAKHAGQRRDEGMLGAGIYFGDVSSTSAHYTTPASTTGHRFMLLCRVRLNP